MWAVSSWIRQATLHIKVETIVKITSAALLGCFTAFTRGREARSLIAGKHWPAGATGLQRWIVLHLCIIETGLLVRWRFVLGNASTGTTQERACSLQIVHNTD
jgi:hypothetical protein